MVDYNYKCPKCGSRPDQVLEYTNESQFQCKNPKCYVGYVTVAKRVTFKSVEEAFNRYYEKTS